MQLPHDTLIAQFRPGPPARPLPEARPRPRLVAGVVDLVIPGVTGRHARRFLVTSRTASAVWLRPLGVADGTRVMLPRAGFDALVDQGGEP